MGSIRIFLSIPKTIWFNFKYLTFTQALKLPIWISYKTTVGGGGKINLLTKAMLAMIRIGFHQVPVCESKARTVIYVSSKGQLVFKGTAHIGNGTKIYVADGAELIIGNNFAISASSQINCYKRIVFGNDIQFSWDCLVMDSDTHIIYDENSGVMNTPREIIFGNKIWIGCRATILKGTIIPDNCVIGACSLVTGHKLDSNSIIVGSPASSIKILGGWKL